MLITDVLCNIDTLFNILNSNMSIYTVFLHYIIVFFFFQAEDGIRDCLLSRGLGDVYKRQVDYSGF